MNGYHTSAASAVSPLLNSDLQIESLAAQLLNIKCNPEYTPVSALEYARSQRKVASWLDTKNIASIYPTCPFPPCHELSPLCQPDCPYQTTELYSRRCECLSNSGKVVIAVECRKCQQDFQCKTLVIDSTLLKCTCFPFTPAYSFSERLARNCSKCIRKVKDLLLSNYAPPPACMCKNIYSTDLFKCRPECVYRINELYQLWFPSDSKPMLYVWQSHTQDSKMLLPVCKCWRPHESMVCLPSCSEQYSERYRDLYDNACPCLASNPSKSFYAIDDRYVHLFKCWRCMLENEVFV
jgi:hypothetical protein